MGAQCDLMIEVNVRILVTFVAGKTGSEQALLQCRCFRNMDGLAVEVRALPYFGAEEFIARWIVNDSGYAFCFRILPMFQRHRHTEDRVSVSKIRGAVERIDVPTVVAALIVEALLFPEDVVRGKQLSDALADQSL